MVTDFIIDLFQRAITGLLGLIPAGLIPESAGWHGRAVEMASQYGWAGYWLPFGTAASAAQAVLGCWVALQGFQVVKWALTKLHITGGSD